VDTGSLATWPSLAPLLLSHERSRAGQGRSDRPTVHRSILQLANTPVSGTHSADKKKAIVSLRAVDFWQTSSPTPRFICPDRSRTLSQLKDHPSIASKAAPVPSPDHSLRASLPDWEAHPLPLPARSAKE